MAVLTEKELAHAQSIINQTKSGDYKLKDMFGSEWKKVKSPTSYGTKFKESVSTGKLMNINHKDCDTDNANIYEIIQLKGSDSK